MFNLAIIFEHLKVVYFNPKVDFSKPLILNLFFSINLLINQVHFSLCQNPSSYCANHLISCLKNHFLAINLKHFSKLIFLYCTFKSSITPISFFCLSFSLYYLSSSFLRSSASFAFFLNFSNSLIFILLFVLLINPLDFLRIVFIISLNP